MGRMHMEEYKEYLGNEQGLRVHLQANFYPPIPGDAQDIIIEEFEKHWKDKCHYQVLLERINRKLKKSDGKIIGLNSLDHFDSFVLSEEEIKPIPPRKEKNKWAFPKAKVNRILKNIREVFKNANIDHLNKETYDFIILKMGFIAHYSLYGFRDHYSNFSEFAKNLLTTEMGRDDECNTKHAARQENDADFNKWYGAEYCTRSAEVMRGICEIATKYLKGGIR